MDIKISNRTTNFLAVFLLLSMFFLSTFSLKDDSATFDEAAYIPAGYSYLTQKDYRLNPEHPPLIKELAVIPLLFLDLNFPKNSPAWESANQWQFGQEFLYYSGNNLDKILFRARLSIVFLSIFLGWFLFHWARKLGGNKTALLVLTLFSFSPTFLAHGRLVTTDLAATLGVVLAVYFWLKFLENPSRKNIIFAGLILGLALLFKFSLLILVPFLGLITLIYVLLKTKKINQILKYVSQAILAGIISMLVIWLIYQFQITSYFSGALMAIKRATLPSWWPTYLLGQISSFGFWYYFPVTYFLKIPLAFHILTLIALFGAFWKTKKRSFSKLGEKIQGWIAEHFTEFTMIAFLIVYWLVAVNSRLNIGVRHLLPTFPFIYILVSLGIKNWLKNVRLPFKKIAVCSISVLLVWYALSSLIAYPYYLSYFNEIAGGSENGYKYVVDSNCDWGQDLKRLARWVDEQGIEKIYVDYFGGGNVEYYLGEKAVLWYGSSWWSWSGWQTLEKFPRGNYFAVSATFLQGGRGEPAPGFNWSAGEYSWLNSYQPLVQIGNSIFVYYVY